MSWPVVAAATALVAVMAQSMLDGLTALALIALLLTVAPPRPVGRRVLPLALVAFTVAAVAWVRHQAATLFAGT